MSLYSIIVVNNAPGCDNSITQQVSSTGCSNFIVRITQNTNAIGPFSVYLGSVSPANLLFSGLTRQDMLNGVVVQVGPGCTPTPTPTNTPTVTPTKTPTPTPSVGPEATATPTPSVTTTLTPTPSVTPTLTVTATPTATPNATPTTTPTNTPTPTTTPTNTPTPTTTPTPTPVLEISIITQDGQTILQQDGQPILLQQLVTSYLVATGIASCNTGTYTLDTTLYSSSPDWNNVTSFYTDISLTTPFNGNDLWVTNESGGCGMYQVGTNGFVIGGICNPC